MIILDEFQKMFDQIVMPFIDGLEIENEYLQPVFYTLRKKSNKFRSATSLLAAKICGGSHNDILPIAATSEIIHSSIIIQDDIADGDLIRRGKKVAHIQYGICYALHSSLYAVMTCLDVLDKLNPASKISKLKTDFLAEHQYVCKSQIGQCILDLSQQIDYSDFLNIHLGKTAIGRWAISASAVFYGKNDFFLLFKKFAEKLGDAGSIKNDIEDFLNNDGYEPFCSDIREGRLTYPIYLYFSRSDVMERENFLKIFGKNRDMDYSKIRQKILDAGIILHAIEKINILVAEAINLLNVLPPSQEKQMLTFWANHHYCIGK